MEFNEFRDLLTKHVEEMTKDINFLFVTNTNSYELWNLYLDSFPIRTNEIFRKKREYDCSCCKNFIKTFGNIVSIVNNKIISIWDFKTNDQTFQPVIDKLSKYVKSKSIKDVFVTNSLQFGIKQTIEDNNLIWNHFFIDLNKKFLYKSNKTIDTIKGNLKTAKEVFQRTMNEISFNSIESVLDLINQESLYEGLKWKDRLLTILNEKYKYDKLNPTEKNLFSWERSVVLGQYISKIKNHSIGVLLIDISNEVDLDIAVKRYESIVAPTNYKRPKEIFTKQMVKDALNTLNSLGYENSYQRRFANIDDISINNVLFTNRNILRNTKKDIMSILTENAIQKPKKYNKIDEINIEDFIKNVIPNISNMEILFENKHVNNLMSIITAIDKNSKSMLKWNNNESWSYYGNLTDTNIKETVKKLGGNVNGVLRCSIQWNEKRENQNDFDIHCIEPTKTRIYYPKAGKRLPSSGILDVDIIKPGNKTAAENIIYTDLNKMPEGEYEFFVHVFFEKGGKNGFRAEIEFNNKIYRYNCDKQFRNGEFISIAKVLYNRQDGFTIKNSLNNTYIPMKIWGLQQDEFHPVKMMMLSPNYWNNTKYKGNKHYFFIIDKCINNGQPNGFYNDFIKDELILENKRVIAAIGSRMKVAESNNQLSGIGFSSTIRNEVIVKVEGNFSRLLKIKF